jgi:membrane protease YdiL (CAAX protease family)
MANPIMWPLAAFISFMSGPWSEEFGWRGFALDRFILQFGVLRGSVGLGLVWAVWHLPLYFMPNTWHGQMGFKLAGFWTFIVLSMGLSLIMTWIYLASNRSILSAMLLHFASNFTGQLIAPNSDTAEILRSVLILAIGLVACYQMTQKMRSQELNRIPEKVTA